MAIRHFPIGEEHSQSKTNLAKELHSDPFWNVSSLLRHQRALLAKKALGTIVHFFEKRKIDPFTKELEQELATSWRSLPLEKVRFESWILNPCFHLSQALNQFWYGSGNPQRNQRIWLIQSPIFLWFMFWKSFGPLSILEDFEKLVKAVICCYQRFLRKKCRRVAARLFD